MHAQVKHNASSGSTAEGRQAYISGAQGSAPRPMTKQQQQQHVSVAGPQDSAESGKTFTYVKDVMVVPAEHEWDCCEGCCKLWGAKVPAVVAKVVLLYLAQHCRREGFLGTHLHPRRETLNTVSAV